MKKLLVSITTVASIATITLNAEDMKATFADPQTWDGKVVPKEAVCSDYNIKAGSSPEIMLRNIPKGSQNIILSFTNESFIGMRDGGHGVLSYTLEDDTYKAIIPTVEGETFVLPQEFSSLRQHHGVKYGKTQGAYLAPCSGGKGNTYSVLIQAVDKNDVILDTTSLNLGKY